MPLEHLLTFPTLFQYMFKIDCIFIKIKKRKRKKKRECELSLKFFVLIH